jgi:hypothetical protein
VRGNAIETTSETGSTGAVRDIAPGSKHQTIAGAIKALFKAAVKAVTQPNLDAPQPKTKRRRSGGTESRAPLISVLRIAARGRYAGMRPAHRAAVKLRRAFTAAADDAALPEISDVAEPGAGNTLEWLTLWQQSEDFGHGFDNEFSAHQDRNFPSP